MPFFKSTYNILVKPDEDEVFNENLMNNPTSLGIPPKVDWDYKRPMTIEDVDIWEVIYEQGGGIGIYASWSPFAEFYLVRRGGFYDLSNPGLETYYGPMANKKVIKVIKEMGLSNIVINKIWVEPEDMWLYQEEDNKKTIFIT